MNTEYRKLLLESLEKVHQAIDDAEPAELPGLVHAEIEILSIMEKGDQGARTSNDLNRLLTTIEKRLNSSLDKLSI